MTSNVARDWEDVRGYDLAPDDETELLARQTECTFVWLGASGHPVGVVMNFVFRDGRFWLTASRRRKRIAAVERDPRVSVVLSSRGSGIAARRSLTYQGRCVVHDDDATKEWFYPALAAAVRPGQPERAAAFRAQLDSPGRVVLEVVPRLRIGFDGDRMWQASPPLAAPAD
jgi:nitroimidazol reductase NimA-like FMN-containing flavoprotein (pyridoxamine 5'-phosphate oxidase superfamily)